MLVVGGRLRAQPVGPATAAYCYGETRPLFVSVRGSEGEEKEAGGGCRAPWTVAWGQ